MHNVGILWQYAQNESTEQTKINSDECQLDNYPLLGRRVELMIVAAQVMLLDEPLTSSKPRRDLAAIIFQGNFSLVVPIISRFSQVMIKSVEVVSYNFSFNPSPRLRIPSKINLPFE